MEITSGLAEVSYTTSIYLSQGGTGGYPGGGTLTSYARQRYVTASGEVFWVFILRTKVDYETEILCGTKKEKHITHAGTIISTWVSSDHPCFGNGGKPLLVPHPFGSYDPKTQEIVVINPTKEQIAKCSVKMEGKPALSFFESMQKFYDIDENSNPVWPNEEVTVSLPKRKEWNAEKIGVSIIPIKRVILKPDNVITRALKLKR